jgi:Flp pilus assembly protein TadG
MMFGGVLKGEKGVAAIEFAIVLPVLILLVFGIIEFSILFYDKAMITNASREGARAGIVYNFPDRLSAGEIETIARNYCADHLISFGSSDNVNVDVVTGAVSGDPLTVTVEYPYTFLVLPNFATSLIGTITLRAQTVMRME